MNPRIHPSAIVSPNAKLGQDVEIGPFCIVGDDVELGDGCHLISHVVVHPGTQLGARGRVHPFAVLGGDPQDLGFDRSKKTRVVIGEDTVFHEGATVHRSTKEGEATRIGHHGFFMANSHVAHDCVVGHHVIFANGALIAGHVRIDDYAFISGNAVVHQHCHIGEGVMLSGVSCASGDVAPFCNAAERNVLHGLNLVGMRRRKFPLETIRQIKSCYFKVFGPNGSTAKLAAQALEENPHFAPQTKQFLSFFLGEHRALLRPGYKNAEVEVPVE